MRCIRCGSENGIGKKICHSCMSDWSKMRSTAFEYLQNKHGKMSQETLSILQKEMKRLDRLWHKDRDKFENEIKSAVHGAAGNCSAEDGSPNKRMSAIDESNIVESSTASC